MNATKRLPARRRGRTLMVAVLPLAAGVAVLAPPPVADPVGLGAGEAQAQSCPGKKANAGTIGVAQASRSVTCLINRRRKARNLFPLEERAGLRLAARRHSVRMVNSACISHNCPGEPPLLGRIRRTNYLPCSCRFGLGEAIAIGARKRGRPIRVVRRWIRTRRYRKVLFNRKFRHIGVGVVWGGPGAPNDTRFGTYTADFGYKR